MNNDLRDDNDARYKMAEVIDLIAEGLNQPAMLLLHKVLPEYILCALECAVDKNGTTSELGMLAPIHILRECMQDADDDPYRVDELSSDAELKIATEALITDADIAYTEWYVPHGGEHDLSWEQLVYWYGEQVANWHNFTDWEYAHG